MYAVPDVATGTAAHITGVPIEIEKKTVGGEVSDHARPERPLLPRSRSRRPRRLGSLSVVRTTSKVTLAHARNGGIRVAFYVPTGSKVVRLRLSRGGKTKYLTYRYAGTGRHAPGGAPQGQVPVANLSRGTHHADREHGSEPDAAGQRGQEQASSFADADRSTKHPDGPGTPGAVGGLGLANRRE